MKARDESKELEQLIQSSGLSYDQCKSIIDKSPEELEPEPVFEIDYDKEKQKCSSKARADVKYMVKSIVPKDVINSPIIRNKIEQDAIQLGMLYWQQKMIETVLKANMGSIGQGNLSPRMFETFTMLSKNHSDIAKQIAEFQVSMRKNYNEMKWDIRAKKDDDNNVNALGENSDKVKIIEEQRKNENMYLGSRDIISNIAEIKKKKAIEIIEENKDEK